MLPQVQREISKRGHEQDNKKFGHGVSKAFIQMADKLGKEIIRKPTFEKGARD